MIVCVLLDQPWSYCCKDETVDRTCEMFRNTFWNILNQSMCIMKTAESANQKRLFWWQVVTSAHQGVCDGSGTRLEVQTDRSCIERRQRTEQH